ncbi:hypothetical protein ABIC09_006736 [Bradyrhizobium sp. S3.12.5]
MARYYIKKSGLGPRDVNIIAVGSGAPGLDQRLGHRDTLALPAGQLMRIALLEPFQADLSSNPSASRRIR